MSVLAATAIGAGISALTSMAVNAWNSYQTKKANEKNESLMRESWQREDEAVQRRVADLKAAGMSPLLAAGSAASTSGPISVNAPKSDFNIDAAQALSLASALKKENAETKLLEKEYENYGKPDWYIALKETLGAEKFDKLINAFGDKLYDWIFGGTPSNPESDPVPFQDYVPGEVPSNPFSTPSVSSPVNNDLAQSLLEDAGVDTSKPSPSSSPSYFGITDKSLIKDGEYFIEQLRKDGKLSKDNISRIAYSLGRIYNARMGDIFDWLMSLAGLEH